MVDQNTAKYLNDNIGSVLTKALADMSVQQPTDGADFLAQWLLTYAEQEESRIQREKDEKQTQEDRAVTQQREDQKATRRTQIAADKKTISDSYQALLDKFNNQEQMFQDGYWTELVNVTKQFVAAQSVYLGVLDEEGVEGADPPVIRYTHENIFAGSPSLLDKILPKMKDAETSTLTYGALTESVPEEEQAAKCLWKPAPPPRPPVPEGEEPPPLPEGPKYLPVAVPCVTDAPGMHYFELPRLGGYFACPLVYSSYYTQEALGQARQFESEKAETMRIKAEREAERQAAIEEANEKGLEEPVFEAEEEQPEKELVLTGTTTKLVLCMDTLGTNTLLDTSKYEAVMALCDACAACKSRSEIKEIDAQAIFAIGSDRRAAAEDLESGLPSLREDAKTAVQQQQEDALKEIADQGLEQEARRAVEEICYKKIAHLQAKQVVGYYKEHIKTWAKAFFTVSPEVLNIMAAILFLLGYSREEVYPPRKSMLKWFTIKNLIVDDRLEPDAFFNKVEASDMELGKKGLSNEQKLAFIQSLIPADFNAEKAKEVDPAFEVLWIFLSTAIDYRDSALKRMQADYAERKKKAEEEEQTFVEPDLTTVDDDFEGILSKA